MQCLGYRAEQRGRHLGFFRTAVDGAVAYARCEQRITYRTEARAAARAKSAAGAAAQPPSAAAGAIAKRQRRGGGDADLVQDASRSHQGVTGADPAPSRVRI